MKLENELRKSGTVDSFAQKQLSLNYVIVWVSAREGYDLEKALLRRDEALSLGSVGAKLNPDPVTFIQINCM